MNENDNEVLEMFDGGLNPSAIAQELNISEGTVRGVLKAHGRELPGHKRSTENVDTGAVVEAYNGDVPAREILVTFGLTYTKLYHILEEAGVPIRKVARAEGKKRSMDEAVSLYEDGYPLYAIKEETGIAQPQLHAELHLRGVPLRRPR